MSEQPTLPAARVTPGGGCQVCLDVRPDGRELRRKWLPGACRGNSFSRSRVLSIYALNGRAGGRSLCGRVWKDDRACRAVDCPVVPSP